MSKAFWGFFFLFGLLVSCRDTNRSHINHIVSEWEGREVLFPRQPVFVVNGVDTVHGIDVDASSYKIINYVDSVGCVSCKLLLPLWKRFIAELDSVTGGSVPVYMFFTPKDIREIRYIIRRDGYTYPVCIDMDDEFNRLNRFPEEQMFHTFLLDSCNRVVAMGNPVHNNKINQLYYDILAGKDLIAGSRPLTEVSVTSQVVDLGVISDVADTTLYIKNVGTSDLKVSDVLTSCECTSATVSSSTAHSGDSLALHIVQKAEEKGPFVRDVYVYCNIAGEILEIQLMGKVQ